MKIKIKIIIAILVLASNIYSLELSDLIDITDEDKVFFAENNYLLNSNFNPIIDGYKLMPSDFTGKEEFLKSVADYSPELCVEMIFFIDSINLSRADTTEYLQENILAVSEQVGIEYFSYSRNKMHPLITKSYFVDSSRNKLMDPKITELREERRFRLFQDDSTFGGNYYTLISRVRGDVIWNQIENESNLTVFYIFKALGENSLRVSYIIIPYNDKIALYSLVQIKEPPKVKEVLGRPVNIPDSVRKRVQALIEWYLERIK